MEEIKEKENLQPDNIDVIDNNTNGNVEISQKSDNDANVNNEIIQQNNDKFTYVDENINKALESFNKKEQNSLFSLASSLINAIAFQKQDENQKDPEDDENQDQKNEIVDDENQDNNKDKNETSESTKTETEFDGETEFVAETEFDNEMKNEVTLVSVLTETDPISVDNNTDNSSSIISDNSGNRFRRLNDQNPYKEPTFQTMLDNPNIAKRPGSSQASKYSSPLRNNNRTRIVIKSNNGNRNLQRPSTASGIRPSTASSLPSEAELQNALDLMIKKKILPDPEIRREVINFARKQVSRKMLEESYDEASEIDIAVDIMFTSIEQDQSKEDEAVKKNALQYRMEQTINKKKETHDKYNEMIADEENIFKAKYNEMLERHILEIESFKNEWRNPDRVKSFNKPSSKLFQMRKQQKSMALLHDFQSAKQMKLMADQLEKQEADVALQRAKETMQMEYQILIEKQQKELSCLKENHEKNINTIKMSQGKDEELVQNTLQLLKFKMEKNKSNKKPKLMVPVKKQKCPTTSQSVPTTGMITYRTRSQLNNYRKESDKSRLHLKFDFIDQDIKKMRFQSQ